MKGRTPKPTALKVLEGNPGHRKIDTASEPTPEKAIPECPDFLDNAAKREWFRMCEELFKLGLLTNLDRAALGAYCSAYSQWEWSENEIPKLQKKMTSAKKAAERRRAWGELCVARGIRKNAFKDMKTFLTELGLSPASRTRIRVKPDDGQGELPLGGAEESPFARAARLAHA